SSHQWSPLRGWTVRQMKSEISASRVLLRVGVRFASWDRLCGCADALRNMPSGGKPLDGLYCEIERYTREAEQKHSRECKWGIHLAIRDQNQVAQALLGGDELADNCPNRC